MFNENDDAKCAFSKDIFAFLGLYALEGPPLIKHYINEMVHILGSKSSLLLGSAIGLKMSNDIIIKYNKILGHHK